MERPFKNSRRSRMSAKWRMTVLAGLIGALVLGVAALVSTNPTEAAKGGGAAARSAPGVRVPASPVQRSLRRNGWVWVSRQQLASAPGAPHVDA
jgi:hypothetical protein